jgi:predicted DNA binding CopG/RHH family protein
MKKKLTDRQLEEFEKADLGIDVRRSRSSEKITPRTRPTSIILSESLINKLRIKAKKRGIGYQTMLKIIVAEQVDRY